MITKNPMQLKAFIKSKAIEKNIPAQLVLQNFVMERLLERISLSKYRRNFILKGGFLISAIVGIDTRTTMDLDATIKGFAINQESLKSIFEEICMVNVKDDLTFNVIQIRDIREKDDYPGMRVSLEASYPPLIIPIKVDLTSGDKITPREIEYSFDLLFENRTISVMAYNLESILAEKLETILSRNEASTRPRDYYDVYILYKLRGGSCDMGVLRAALIMTSKKRGTETIIYNYSNILQSIRKSSRMLTRWENYQREYDYALEIGFVEICDLILAIMDNLHFTPLPVSQP